MSSIKHKANPPQNIIHPIPPYNGYGSEEDSMLNVIYLNPFEKNHEFVADKFKKDKHILRFNAKLISSCPADEERTFIISFYCRDNEIGVFENAGRNSGRIPCKFIEKVRTKNPYTGKYYTEKDFTIGNIIYINKFIFKLLSCDEYTKKYMIDNPEVFKDSDLSCVLNRIRSGSGGEFKGSFEDYLVLMVKEIGKNDKEFVRADEIDNGLRRLGVYLSGQEIITLVDRLRKNGEGKYSVEDLYNIVAMF